MIANNINESIFDRIKDFFKKKPSVRQATEKEKAEDRYYRYADEDKYAGQEDRYAGNEDRFTSGRVETKEKKLKRWQNDPDGAIEDIIKEISEDFIKSPYNDKIDIKTNTDKYLGVVYTIYTYKFEDGFKVIFTLEVGSSRPKLKINYPKYGVTVQIGAEYHNSVMSFLNTMTERSSRRPQYTTTQTKTTKVESNPKKETYNKLKDTLKLRKEHLAKITDAEDRANAQNEINLITKKIAKMKSDYQFEHIKPFKGF